MDSVESLSEKGARLCRRPAAARLALPNACEMCCLLLVEDDTAARRGFQTGTQELPLLH